MKYSAAHFLDRLLNFFQLNMGTKIISLLIAIVLWVVVLGSRNVEVTKEVPLEIVTSSDLVVGSDVPEKIAFRLSGPKAFLRAILDRREEPIRVNLTNSKAGLMTYRFFNDNIRVPIGVKVLSVTPAALLIRLEPLKTREIPVKVQLQGIPPEGYRVIRTEARPSRVKVRGPESRVAALSELVMQSVDISEMRVSEDREARFDLSLANLQILGEIPKVHVEIEAPPANFKIKGVEVRAISNGPNGKVNLSEKTVTLYIRASADMLQNINRDQVSVTIDLRGKLRGKYSETVKVSLPKGVDLVKAVPEKITVTIE